MTNSFEASALAHRIAILDEIGVGPLWLRRDALIDSIPSADAAAPIAVSISAPLPSSMSSMSPTSSRSQPSPPSEKNRTAPAANAPAGDAAWDDDAPAAAGAAAPIKTSLTLCIRTGADDGAAALRYLFIARSSSVQGAEELFDNILLALGMRKEAQTAGDLPGLPSQIAAHKPSVLIVMEPAAALQLVAGDDGDGSNDDGAFDALRGRMHRVGGLPVLVTYGAVHLLRNPADKRKAWDDLCLLTTLQATDVADPA